VGDSGRRRELCLWLATLASWRGGLVRRLVREYGGVSEALDRPVAELRALLRPARPAEARPSTTDTARDGAGVAEARAAERRADQAYYRAVLEASPGGLARASVGAGRTRLAWCDPLYPPALRRLSDPPLCLFVVAGAGEPETRRRLELLCGASPAAVVGTRSPSPYGAEMAALLGRDLALRGVVVVSGLALGIDAAAQAAALRAGRGCGLPTVAVLGCGADVPYPRINARLHRDVAAEGLVVSEFAWGVPARTWRFPARNRVMAGLSRAVVVVEGAARSGARLTAGFAAEIGSEVLAVPGEAGKRLTQAPHALLRQGAAVCESADDVLAAIAGVRLDPELLAGDVDGAVVARLLGARSDDGRLAAVLRALERAALTVDEVAAACRLRVPEAAALLSDLEIEGLAARSAQGTYRLRRA
jgi:DNA processing protein